ncbi:MAG TPA: ATP-binding protein [Burkholderiales bacterium]|nr:ATP-binding protein [Burkholderiales bacterium]
MPAQSDSPSLPLGLRLSSLALGLGRVPALQSRAGVLALAFALVLAVAAADYATGYEIRLAILQLIPIALVTWLVGRRWGLALSAIAVAAWFIEFRSSHDYSHEFYFYWEGAALVATYVVVVLLLARLRDALARSDERFVRALESLPSAVCVTDRASGRVLLSNRRHAELARGAGAAFDPERTDGAHERSDPATGRWYLVETVPLRWLDGSEAALTSFTDITESKQAQALREQHAAAVAHAARAMALGELASTLAHELNQPLVAIAAYNEGCIRLLESGAPDSPELAEAMERCRRQAVRAGEIVKRMREFVRRREPVREAVAIDGLVRGALELAAHDLAGVTTTLELAPDLPPVSADSFMIEQVLLNLIRNATEAMQTTPAPGRVLELRTARAAPGAVAVAVRDHGPGLASGPAARLFQPFASAKPGGLGLGLALCRSMVEAHGGELVHEAAPGGGAIFRFTLPAAAR